MKSGEQITAEDIQESGLYPVFGGNGLRGFTSAYTHEGLFALIGRQGALCGNINYATGKFWASEHAVVVSQRRFAAVRWIGELLRSMNLGQYSMTAAQPGLSVEAIGNLLIPVPPPDEQAAIAAFLDRETGKIDALVAEQERLISLLKEKRQAVISHAVTKGLNPNAPMKDSGVPWLGSVPAHWEIRSISSLTTKITNGYVGPTRDILTADGVRYLQSLHIKQNRISFHSPYYVSQEWSARHSKSVLAAGDVLVVQTGDVGQTAVVTDEFTGCNCHALIILAPMDHLLTGCWLSWVLNSSYGQQTLTSIQTGALHPHLNCGDVKDVPIPLPSVPEQEEITTRIERDRGRLAQLEGEATRAITLLRERRAALISAAVTGKIDVRDHAPATQAEAA